MAQMRLNGPLSQEFEYWDTKIEMLFRMCGTLCDTSSFLASGAAHGQDSWRPHEQPISFQEIHFYLSWPQVMSRYSMRQ